MTRDFSKAQGVVFDCDGTLLDSIGMWNSLEEDLCRIAGIHYDQEVQALLTTLTLPESSVWFHDHGFLSSAQEVSQYIDDYLMDYYQHRAELRPGAFEMVRRLHERGLKLTCASSTPHAPLEAGLVAVGLRPYFLAVVSTDDVNSSKRDPKIYEYCRAIMGTEVADTWGCEDAIYAVRTLNAAGFGTVGIYDRDESGTWEELSAEAAVAIRSWEELL